MQSANLSNGVILEIFFKCYGNWIQEVLIDDKERFDRANRRIIAVLMNDQNNHPIEEIPSEILTDDENVRYEIISGYLSFLGISNAIRDCEHYFKNYPFEDGEMRRSDHLRICCEMLFDRVAQAKDRLKHVLNIIKKHDKNHEIEVGHILKIYNKIFVSVLKARNMVHHVSRFSDQDIERMSLLENLSIGIQISKSKSIHEKRYDKEFSRNELALIYKKSSEKWIDNIKYYADYINKFGDIIGIYILLHGGIFKKYLSDEDYSRIKSVKTIDFGPR